MSALPSPAPPKSLLPAAAPSRVEFVGPQVGEELAEAGGLATLFALLMILAYVAFRFQWKFAVGAVAALVAKHGWTLRELHEEPFSLEDTFIALTKQASDPAAAPKEEVV